MYCQNCGAQVLEGSSFCAKCGQSVVMGAVRAPDNRVARHIRLLGILWIVRGGLKLIAGLVVLVVGRTILPLVFGELAMPRFPAFVPALVSASGWVIVILAIPSLAAGIGLLNRESWARPLAIVMGFLSLLSPILGTALGIYTLWVLLPTQSDVEYHQITRTV